MNHSLVYIGDLNWNGLGEKLIFWKGLLFPLLFIGNKKQRASYKPAKYIDFVSKMTRPENKLIPKDTK